MAFISLHTHNPPSIRGKKRKQTNKRKKKAVAEDRMDECHYHPPTLCALRLSSMVMIYIFEFLHAQMQKHRKIFSTVAKL